MPIHRIISFLTLAIFLIAGCIGLASLGGCNSEQTGKVHDASQDVGNAATQPAAQAVASGVPYGQVVLAGIIALTTIVTTTTGWLQQVQKTNEQKAAVVEQQAVVAAHQAAVAEVVSDIRPDGYLQPGVGYTSSTQKIVSSVAGISAAAPIPAQSSVLLPGVLLDSAAPINQSGAGQVSAVPCA